MLTKIPGEIAEELYDLSDGESTDDDQFARVSDQEGGSGRWREYHMIVFLDKSDYKHYAFDYAMDLTENQDNDFPWKDNWDEEYNEVRVYPVDSEQVMVTRWFSIK